MSPAVPATVTTSDGVAQLLKRYEPVVNKLLARFDVSAETFLAQVANAMRAQPKLWHCDPGTVLGAALRCAQVGLAPNDGTNACWIIPYGKVATFQLGYGGVLELARRANPGVLFSGATVYPNDLFSLETVNGTSKLRHVPYFSRSGKVGASRGGPGRAWYVTISWPDGRSHVHWVDREQVEYHRSFSKQPDGEAWTKSYDAMALKSAILDMKRWLPTSPQMATAVAADGAVVDVRELEAEPTAGEAVAADIGGDVADPDSVADAKGETA